MRRSLVREPRITRPTLAALVAALRVRLLVTCSCKANAHSPSVTTRDGDDYMLSAGHCHARDENEHYAWIYTGTSNPDQYAGHSSLSTWNSADGTLPTATDDLNHGDL